MRSALLLLALALLLAGCGGGANAEQAAARTGAAAAVAPADAAGYVGIDTDLDSSQWRQLQTLLGRFPDGDKLIQSLVDDLGEEGVSWEEDVRPALGPLTALVILKGSEGPEGPVVLTQPADRGKLDALLAKADEPTFTAELEDRWVAIASKQASLDAFKAAAARGRLDDSQTFQDAIAGLPEDNVATAYVTGEALKVGGASLANPLGVAGASGLGAGGAEQLRSLGAAVEATNEGLRVVGSVRAETAKIQAYEPRLLERVPDRTIAAVSFHGTPELVNQLGSQQALGPFLPQIEKQLGLKLADVLELLEGEAVLYVRPGLGIPEVTLAVEAPDPARATGIVDRLATGLGAEVETLEVDGVQAHAVSVQQVRIVWAAFDGVLLVSTGTTAVRDFRSEGAKLVDDQAFTTAMDRVGLGERTGGLVYVDLDEAVPFVEGLAGLAGQSLPDKVRRNLEPLASLAAQAAPDGDAVRFEAFLAVDDS